MTTVRNILRLLSGAALALAMTTGVQAQEYPSRPIKLIVGFPPGQGIDSNAREVARRMQDVMGQSWVVDNRAGASGALAQRTGAAAPADGYTLLFTAAGPLVVNAAVHDKPPYDPINDYAPIGGFSTFPMVLVAHPAFPAKTIAELVALAKAKPGDIHYASSGAGVTAHMAMEQLSLAAGIKMNHIPYKGTALAYTDLLSGRVSIMWDTPIAALPLIRDGRVRAIAIGGKSRLASLPDVPTVAESGFPNFEMAVYLGVLGPANMAREIVNKLNAEVVKITREPEARAQFAQQSTDLFASTPEELGAYIKADIARWEKIIREAGIKPQ